MPDSIQVEATMAMHSSTGTAGSSCTALRVMPIFNSLKRKVPQAAATIIAREAAPSRSTGPHCDTQSAPRVMIRAIIITSKAASGIADIAADGYNLLLFKTYLY